MRLEGYYILTSGYISVKGVMDIENTSVKTWAYGTKNNGVIKDTENQSQSVGRKKQR